MVECRRRRAVGDPGDAVRGEAAADRGQVGWATVGQAVVQPIVEPEHTARRVAARISFDAGLLGLERTDAFQGGRIEHPHRARTVLDPDRSSRRQLVESPAVERTALGFVVPDGADPFARPSVAVRRADGVIEAAAHVDRVQGGRHGHEMEVVVVQSRQEGAPATADLPVCTAEPARWPDGGDGRLVDAHVDQRAVDLGPAQYQRAERAQRRSRSNGRCAAGRRCPATPRFVDPPLDTFIDAGTAQNLLG